MTLKDLFIFYFFLMELNYTEPFVPSFHWNSFQGCIVFTYSVSLFLMTVLTCYIKTGHCIFLEHCWYPSYYWPLKIPFGSCPFASVLLLGWSGLSLWVSHLSSFLAVCSLKSLSQSIAKLYKYCLDMTLQFRFLPLNLANLFRCLINISTWVYVFGQDKLL